MPKLLIADHSEVRTSSLKSALDSQWEIHACIDSYPVIDTLKHIDPDAMIINLNIPPQNGLSILQDSFPNLPPVILALTDFVSPYIIERSESLGVGSLMKVPCKVNYIIETLTDMYCSHLEKPSLLMQHLRVLGINSNLEGYQCLTAAIPFFKSDRTLLLKEVFPTVAAICKLNDDRCVEHAIRTALRDAWDNRDPAIWKHYFPTHTQCPSNKEFIARIAEFI